MVFVRTHLIKGRHSGAQMEELGAKLIQAVADVEGPVNNAENPKTSWVQFYEFDPENGYAPATLAGSRPASRIQLDLSPPAQTRPYPSSPPTHTGQSPRGGANRP